MFSATFNPLLVTERRGKSAKLTSQGKKIESRGKHTVICFPKYHPRGIFKEGGDARGGGFFGTPSPTCQSTSSRYYDTRARFK